MATVKRADKLTEAILAKAFRGELVPPPRGNFDRRQSRDYEPASVLLEHALILIKRVNVCSYGYR